MNKKKLRIRGFNQAQLLGIGIGKALKIPMDSGLLLRSRYTAPQKELNSCTSFEKIFRKSFGPGKGIYKYKSVLLVDDIYTIREYNENLQ